MPDDTLGRAADRKTVLKLHGAGLLSAEARDEALRLLRPPLAWWRWTSRLLLLVGAALVLAGVVFFFAYNWARMAAWMKFALIEGGLVGCVIAAWFVGLDKLAGKVLTLAAATLTGALLAVYGQTYQTGADPYELFLGWALLILGWVAIMRFGALWIMWLVILNTGVILYWVQVAMPNEAASFAGLCILLALVNGAALAGRELGAERGMVWLKRAWLRYILVPAALAYPTMSTVVTIVDAEHRHAADVLGVVVWLVAMGLPVWFYRYRARDLRGLAFCALSGCVVVLSFLGMVLFEISHGAGMSLFFGLVVIGVVGGAALLLQRTSRQMRQES
jgi:uncharacterized membrane protein